MKEFIKALLLLVVIFTVLFLGFSWGLSTRQVHHLSERLEACEDAGGKYNYLWSNLGGYYYERCEIIDDEIHNF
jgi:hypothetical protein